TRAPLANAGPYDFMNSGENQNTTAAPAAVSAVVEPSDVRTIRRQSRYCRAAWLLESIGSVTWNSMLGRNSSAVFHLSAALYSPSSASPDGFRASSTETAQLDPAIRTALIHSDADVVRMPGSSLPP